MLITDAEAEEENEGESEETDEEFEWFEPDEGHNDECYFVFVNKNRKTIQPGKEIYNCYGNRTNKFLLLNYGFCYPDNSYDSYSVNMRCDIEVTDVFVPSLVDFKQ